MLTFEKRHCEIRAYQAMLVKIVLEIPCELNHNLYFDKRFVRQESRQLFLLQPVNELVNRAFKNWLDVIYDDDYDK